MVARRLSLPSLCCWLRLSVSVAILVACSRLEASAEDGWDTEPAPAWVRESTDAEKDDSKSSETATMDQTHTSTTLEELYAPTQSPDPTGPSNEQDVYAPYNPQPGVSALDTALRITGQKRITTGLLLILVGMLLSALYINLYVGVPEGVYESLKREGYVVWEEAFPEESRAAWILDRVALCFFLSLAGLVVLTSGIISRIRGKAKATLWLMQHLANTVAELPFPLYELKPNFEKRDEEPANQMDI